jgi:hypothetical protein
MVQSIKHWPRANQIELDAIQRYLRAEGPAGLDWSAYELSGFPDWEAIEQSVSRVFHTAFQERVYRLHLEILPGQTIVVRKAEHFVSPFWR